MKLAVMVLPAISVLFVNSPDAQCAAARAMPGRTLGNKLGIAQAPLPGGTDRDSPASIAPGPEHPQVYDQNFEESSPPQIKAPVAQSKPPVTHSEAPAKISAGAERANSSLQTSNPDSEVISLFDSNFTGLIERYHIPGIQVALACNGKLVAAKAYGLADRDNNRLMTPDTVLRIASISKIITAAALLHLIEEGKLCLEDKAFPLLQNRLGALPKSADPRLTLITVRDLLDMRAGFSQKKFRDYVVNNMARRIARWAHATPPVDFDTTLRYALSKRLAYQPGAHFAYSNLSYGVLGDIIEVVSGDSYAHYVQAHLFQPFAITGITPASTRQRDCLPEEAAYDAAREPRVPGLFSDERGKVDAPYAHTSLEANLPSLGWRANAVQLATFIDNITFNVAPQPEQNFEKAYTALGWFIHPGCGGSLTLFKDGTLPGTRAFVVRTIPGATCVVLCNGRPPHHKPDQFQIDVRKIITSLLDAAK